MMYFITTLYTDKGLPLKDRRNTTVGYFEKLEHALYVVKYNIGDIQEHYYNYVVIEGVKPSLYRTVEEKDSHWFKWIVDKWVRIEKPKFLKHICNFSI